MKHGSGAAGDDRSLLHARERVAEAMATFRRCEQVLADQLQISPAQATRDLYATLKK